MHSQRYIPAAFYLFHSPTALCKRRFFLFIEGLLEFSTSCCKRYMAWTHSGDSVHHLVSAFVTSYRPPSVPQGFNGRCHDVVAPEWYLVHTHSQDSRYFPSCSASGHACCTHVVRSLVPMPWSVSHITPVVFREVSRACVL